MIISFFHETSFLRKSLIKGIDGPLDADSTDQIEELIELGQSLHAASEEDINTHLEKSSNMNNTIDTHIYIHTT